MLADRQTERQTDRQTDIATYRAAIAANNTTECSDFINYNNGNNDYALMIAYHFHKTRCGRTEGPTDIATRRAAIAAQIA